jgi:hypothetical protein
LFHLSRHEAVRETWRQPVAKFPADVAFDADLKGGEERQAVRRIKGGCVMRTDFGSRLGRASAAIAVTLAALVGVASAASAQSCNTPWSNCGWTWGERYGAPPPGANYSYYQGYYPQQRYYPQQYYQQPYYQSQPSYPAYGSNPQAAVGQLFGMFVR